MIQLMSLEELTFIDPYIKTNRENRPRKYNMRGVEKKSGIYFIKENGLLVYIGMSRSNLQEAMYRHFQHWKSWKQRRVSYKYTLDTHNYEVACVTTGKDMAHPLERAYILKFNPRDNFDRYEEYSAIVSEIKIREDNSDGGIIIHEHFEHAF